MSVEGFEVCVPDAQSYAIWMQKMWSCFNVIQELEIASFGAYELNTQGVTTKSSKVTICNLTEQFYSSIQRT